MSNSQNGWSDLSGYGDPRIQALEVDGVAFAPGVRSGDVHTVFSWLLGLWAARVERPIKGECWGYSDLSAGSHISNSNHESGTAVDINASHHPRNTPTAKTYSTAQIAEAHTLLALTEFQGHRVIDWGGDYTSPSEVDSMHLEVNVPAATLAEFVKTLSGLNSTPAAPVHPVPAKTAGTYEAYKHGAHPGSRTIGQFTNGPWSAGDDVKAFQTVYNKWEPHEHQLTLDGLFGPETTAACKLIQTRSYITADGIVGPVTWHTIGY